MNLGGETSVTGQDGAGNLVIRLLLIMPIVTAGCGLASLGYQMATAGFIASATAAAIAAYFWSRDGASGLMPSLAAASLGTQLAVTVVMFLPLRTPAVGLFDLAHGLFFVGLAITAAWADAAAIFVFYTVALLWVAIGYALLPPGLALGDGSPARLTGLFCAYTLLAGALTMLIRRGPRRFPDRADSSIEEGILDP